MGLSAIPPYFILSGKLGAEWHLISTLSRTEMSIAYKPLPIDAMAGTSRDEFTTPLDGLQSYTSTDGGAPPQMRFKLETNKLIDTEFLYLGGVFTVAYTSGATNQALTPPVPQANNTTAGLSVNSKATTGGILCPQAVESIVERLITRAGGFSVDTIPSKYSFLQSMLNTAMPNERARNFGGVLGLGKLEDRLIPFSNVQDVPVTAGWQGRELLIPIHASMFSNPRSGLFPAKWIRGGLEIELTFAQPSDILGLVKPTDQNGVQVDVVLTSLSFTITSPRLYYRSMRTAADELWTAKLRAGGSIPYPITRWSVSTNTIPASNTDTWDWNLPIPGTDVRAVIFGFQVAGRRGISNPWCWSDDSTYPYHTSGFSNPNAYGALYSDAPARVGSATGRLPNAAGLRSATLFVNDEPVPAYGGGFRFISTTAVPSAATAFLEWQKVAAIISDSQEFGSSNLAYREFVDNEYCETRKVPTTVQAADAPGANSLFTGVPAIGGDYKLESRPHSFFLAFSLSSDPMNDDDRAGLGMFSDTDGKMVRLHLEFDNAPGVAYNATTNRFGGDIIVTAFSVRKSTLLISEESVTVTDRIVVA